MTIFRKFFHLEGGYSPVLENFSTEKNLLSKFQNVDKFDKFDKFGKFEKLKLKLKKKLRTSAFKHVTVPQLLVEGYRSQKIVNSPSVRP